VDCAPKSARIARAFGRKLSDQGALGKSSCTPHPSAPRVFHDLKKRKPIPAANENRATIVTLMQQDVEKSFEFVGSQLAMDRRFPAVVPETHDQNRERHRKRTECIHLPEEVLEDYCNPPDVLAKLLSVADGG
jgi:hypothetical protein